MATQVNPELQNAPALISNAKMELMAITSALMPKGRPNFPAVIQYPTIQKIIDEGGRADITKAVFILVKNFCESVNVVRNMNEDQMIESAAMLVDEAGNYRLEDYAMMFSLMKRGDLVKILDRVDIQVISTARDEYEARRTAAGEREQEQEFQQAEGFLTEGDRTEMEFVEGKGYVKKRGETDHISGFLGVFGAIKNLYNEMEPGPVMEGQAKIDIHKPEPTDIDKERIRQQKQFEEKYGKK